jgi:hypothetical protein
VTVLTIPETRLPTPPKKRQARAGKGVFTARPAGLLRGYLLGFLWVGVAVLVPVGGVSAAADATPYPPVQTQADTLAELKASRERAIKSQKLLMVVLGANWCHDSVGFVTKLQHSDIRKLIDQRYLVQLVNLGFMDQIREIVGHYEIPVIYGTPTVIVVEPVTNTVLNRYSLPFWRNADAISDEDTLDYFSSWTPGQTVLPPPPESPQLAAALADIDAFEGEQAGRIYLAYAELGDIMRDMDADNPSDEFVRKWTNLEDMRGSITEDLKSLRAGARRQAKAGTSPIKLDYPGYPLFID